MTFIDWLVLFLYLIFSLVLGIYISLKNHNEADYFVAGRRLTGLLAGMSMAATTFSIDTPLYVAGIIGTRGLLGEGWDASRINVLIDLTTVTTSMSINQLRGRSIRLDKQWPEKVANNWDVICLAEEFTNGFSDYERFKKKHK